MSCMRTIIETTFWIFFIYIGFFTFLYFKPVSQDIETIKRDNLLIDIIEHNPQEEYLIDAVLYNLSPNVIKKLIDKTEIYDLNDLNLHYAIENNLSSYAIMYIIHHNPVSILEQNDYYEYPLHVALNKRLNVDIIQELLIKGREMSFLSNSTYEFEIEKQLDRNNKSVFELLASY